MGIMQSVRFCGFFNFKRTLIVGFTALCLAFPINTAMHSDAFASTTAKKSSSAKALKVNGKSKVVKVNSKSKNSVTRNKKTNISSRNAKLRQLAQKGKNRVSKDVSAPRNESKHAALVIDAASGKVLYANNATEPRHPASLTKMMTLYLTFEALEKGRLKWGQDLPVSLAASQQAPTNLSLAQGDRISVRDAVFGLIVRSANDAAVVLAEAISGSELRFANLMTQKARALGMRSTTFKNASGLPDTRQITTARDMALLGLALRKHYPQNYKLFSTRAFTFNGRTYESHNRVIMRYAGADGLKTGYTRMSGFNLVTSASKNGYKLVGVVMGGASGKSRDDQMITLLDSSFRKIASIDNKNQFASIEDLKSSATSEYADEVVTEKRPLAITSESKVVALNTPKVTLNSIQKVEDDNPVIQSGQWGIQVGAYEASKDAFMAAANAQAIAPAALSGAKIMVSGLDDLNNKVHRARLVNLSQEQAQNACKELIKRQESCFVYRAETQYAQQM